MHATLVFDVEDPITPESDDVALWLAEIAREEDVAATFFVTGAKARALAERGRTDVIEALARHDVGYHSNTHSVHPTMAESLADAGWDEGVARTLRRERNGIADVERTFGVEPSAYGRTGGSYAPQVAPAMDAAGLAYAYAPVSPPGADVFRVAGALAFGMHTRGFDDVLPDADAFEERLAWLDDHLDERAAAGAEWVGVFGAHPTRVRATEFWDAVNFADGRTPPREEWAAPTLRPASDMDAAREQYRRLLRFLRDDERIEMATIRDLREHYGGQVASLARPDLEALAADVAEGDAIRVDRALSPAESVVAFAGAVLAPDGLPETVVRRDVLGPMADPPGGAECDALSPDELRRAADAVADAALREGTVPAAVTVDGDRVGLAALYFALAEAVVAVAGGGSLSPVTLRDPSPFPAVAEEVAERVPEVHDGWPIHDPALDSRTVTDHAVRQTWTLKPADP